MFGTLLGPLPRPPVAPDAPPEAILDAILDVQAMAGLEPLTDGGWPLVSDDPVAAWRATAARTATTTKAVLDGPFTTGVPIGGSVEPWRRRIADLAAAGCLLVEIHEPGAVGIGDDPAERARFRDLHERLADGWSEVVHLSLAITGGSADPAGPETILSAPYSSLAVDLIDGPDNWRLVRAAPLERGIVCGALDTAEGSDDAKELLVWAVSYAASGGRGIERVGVATAGSLAALPWASVVRKLERIAEAVRITNLPSAERLAALDPRAVDIRSAALGRHDPSAPRPPRP
jgi:hypothetical protein